MTNHHPTLRGAMPSFIGDSGFALALLHEARLRGASERFPIFVDRLGFARIPRTLRHVAVQCRAS
jgi:hypothetical protein